LELTQGLMSKVFFSSFK